MSPLIRINSDIFFMNNKRYSYHLGNSRVLGAWGQEPGEKTKYTFYIIPYVCGLIYLS